MARPVVLIATTDPVMAYALEKRLSEGCRSLGLKLEVCPEGTKPDDILPAVKAYGCAEELFDALEKRDPYELADTLLVLDVGARLTEAFEPAAHNDEHWHVTKNRRAGVAVELILRFPQVFPVILSPAVPVVETKKTDNVIDPFCPETDDDQNWSGFHKLRDNLCVRNKKNGENVWLDIGNLAAMQIPLHFVSPLDKGAGLESTLSRFARGMRCWFDPTGLRTLVKNRFLGTLFGNQQDWSNTYEDQRQVLLKRLGRAAVAIDEEREFALISGYAAWKYGRRAWVVTTYAEFNNHPLWIWAGANRGGDEVGERTTDVVVLRDIDLRFPDVPTDDERIRSHLRDICSKYWYREPKRGAASSHKCSNQWRVRAISGEAPVDVIGTRNARRWSDTDSILGQRNGASSLEYLGFQKPVSSIYALKSVLGKKGAEADQSLLSKITPVVKITEKGSHGAPYVNLAIAESLLRQARSHQETSSASIIGALLAAEAYELLLGMSKTTALEALYEMHRSEVRAEVGIPGTGEATSIKPRRADIKRTVTNLYKGSDVKQSKPVQRLYLSQIWSELRIVYRKGEQFEAAEQANIEGLRYAWGWPRWMLKIGTTIRGWVAAALVSNTLFAIGYAWPLNREWSWAGVANFLSILGQTVLATLQMQYSDLKETAVPMVAYPSGSGLGGFCQYLLAFVHFSVSYVLFGLLVAMLYRKLTRS